MPGIDKGHLPETGTREGHLPETGSREGHPQGIGEGLLPETRKGHLQGTEKGHLQETKLDRGLRIDKKEIGHENILKTKGYQGPEAL